MKLQAFDTNLTETQFYNMVDEINMLSSLLGGMEFNSSPTILLTGIRGVGKTSIDTNFLDNFFRGLNFF